MSYSNPYNQGHGGGGQGYGGYDQQEQHELQQYGQSSPYAQPSPYDQPSPYAEQSPYGNQQQQPQTQQAAPYGNGQHQSHESPTLTQSEFLSRVSIIRNDITRLQSLVSSLGQLHREASSSIDNSAQRKIDQVVSQSQLENTSIREKILALKRDSEATADSHLFRIKKTQFETINTEFKTAIQALLQEERRYKDESREQFARQYRIVNPDATEQEVQAAAASDWTEDGVFQSALKTNRTGLLMTKVGAARLRHEETLKAQAEVLKLVELLQFMESLVLQQEEIVQNVAYQAEDARDQLQQANVHVTGAVEKARARRRKKWWCFAIVVAILLVIALIVGLVVGLQRAGQNTSGGGGGGGSGGGQ